MEKHYKLILVLGILLLLLPLSGLPSAWNMFIAATIGLLLILVAAIYRINLPPDHFGGTKSSTETIYIDSHGHVLDEPVELADDEELNEVEITMEPGQEIKIQIDDEENEK